MISKKYILIIACFIIASCTTAPEKAIQEVEVTRLAQVTQLVTQEIIKEVTREVEITVEVTKIIEVPVTVTSTPGPSPTPTETPTPTITPTFTPSPTPFRTSGCVNLTSVPNYWNIEKEDYPNRIYSVYDSLDGRCVKLYAGGGVGLVAADYGWLSGFVDIDFTFVIDELTPSETKSVDDYSTVWGIWIAEGGGDYKILLRRVEPFKPLQQPIQDDGFYLIGQDFDRSEGQWKSLWPPGTVDNCYWARTNPNTGDIRANHFGQAGIYTRVYTGDLFESDDCAPWVFIP